MKNRQKFGLKEADYRRVLREWSAWVASCEGQIPEQANRIVCRNLTYSRAVEYLSKVNQKILASRRMMAAFVDPFVVGWWIDGRQGEALGFPVEVWMTQAEEDAGLWDIVDRSRTLYRLPWIYGMGWLKGPEWDYLAGVVADRPPRSRIKAWQDVTSHALPSRKS